MASGTLDADKINKEKSRWVAGNKVYTRRPKKGTKNAAAVSSVPPTTTTTTPSSPVPAATLSSPNTTANNNQTLATEDARPILTFVDDRVKIYLEASTSKDEIKDLKEKFEAELDQVRSLFQKLEDKEAEITNYSTNLTTTVTDEADNHSQYPGNVPNPIDRKTLLRVNSEMNTDYMDRRALQRSHSEMGPDLIDRRALMRVNSEIGPLSLNQETIQTQPTRFRPPLSVSVLDNEFIEKEKRTPKANQYYRNSEFLLGKDRLPPETNKRQKPNNGRKYNSDYIEKHKNQVFKNCSNLLQRLMKHKHGWVFKEPVNAKLLGLHDYHDIIKHPMDLGTIKSRLAQNFYKTPLEFAEDVRLTFDNARTYNPQGQDVHVMAEQLSNIFEEKWTVIESEWRYGTTKVNNLHHLTHTPLRSFERSTTFMNRTTKNVVPPVSRTPAPKKPKAKDLNKRNMTYEEKQKLSANLQSLPSEKLDNIVQIIKKSNTSLSQHDDEIEVDIDSVDIETLWELDRFVTNYKKSLSKHRRKAELAQQARLLGGNGNRTMNPTKSVPEAIKEKKADEKNLANSIPNEGDNVSRSSSSSSSSSDSGSSSSDSDSDSSSADGSDGGR